MPLGMEVGLSPGDFVLDGTQLPLSKKGASPIFAAQFLAHIYVAKQLDGSRCHLVQR